MNRAYVALAQVVIATMIFTPIADCAHAAQGTVCAGERVVRVDPALPAYQAQRFELPREASYVADGTIVVVGYNDMSDILHAMGARFSVVHSDVLFRFDLPGTRFAPAALANGTSAFAPMGRCSHRRSSPNTAASRQTSHSRSALPMHRSTRAP